MMRWASSRNLSRTGVPGGSCTRSVFLGRPRGFPETPFTNRPLTGGFPYPRSDLPWPWAATGAGTQEHGAPAWGGALPGWV